jgi:hypothetical protein
LECLPVFPCPVIVLSSIVSEINQDSGTRTKAPKMTLDTTSYPYSDRYSDGKIFHQISEFRPFTYLMPFHSPRILPRRPSLASLRLDSIEEIPEYDLKPLNLGAETPRSDFSGYSTPTSEANRQAIYEWTHSASGLKSLGLPRNRSWRGSSFGRNETREVLETDCGIW